MNEDVERIKIEVDATDAINDLDKVEKKMEDSLGGKSAAKAAKKSSSDISNQYDKATKDITKYFDKSLKEIQKGFKEVNRNADEITKTLKSIKFAREVDIEAKKAANSIRREFSDAIEEIESKANNAAAQMGKRMADNMIDAFNQIRDVWKNFSTLSMAVVPTMSASDMNKMLFDKDLEKAIQGVKNIPDIKLNTDINAKQLSKEITDAVSSIPRNIPMNIKSNFDQAHRDIMNFRNSLDDEFTQTIRVDVNMDNFDQAEKNIDTIASKLKDFDVMSGPAKKYADDLANAFDIKNPAKYSQELNNVSASLKNIRDLFYILNETGDVFESSGVNATTLSDNEADLRAIKGLIDDITKNLNTLKGRDFGVTDNSLAIKYIDTGLELLGKVRPTINAINRGLDTMNGDFSQSSIHAAGLAEKFEELRDNISLFGTDDGLAGVIDQLQELTSSMANAIRVSGKTAATGDALNKGKKTSKGIFGTLGSIFGSEFGPLGSAAGAGLGSILSDAIFGGLGDMNKDIQEELVSILREAAKYAGDVDLTLAADKMFRGFEANDISKIIEDDILKALDDLQHRISGTVDLADALKGNTESAFADIFSSDHMTITGLKEFLEQMEDEVAKTKEDINEQMATIGDPKVLTERIKQHIENMKKSFTNVTGLDAEQFLHIEEDDDIIGEIMLDLAKNFQIPPDAIMSVVGSIALIKDAINALDEVGNKDIGYFNNLEKEANEKLDSATASINQFKEKYMSLLEAISGLDIEGNKDFQRTITNLGKGFIDAKSDADSLDETLLRVNSRHMDAGAWMKINDSFRMVDENVEIVANSIDDIKKRIKAMSDEAVKMGFSLEEILTGSFSEGSAESGIQRMITEVLENVRGELKDLSDAVGLDVNAINSRMREKLFNLDGVSVSGLDAIMKSMQEDLQSYMVMIESDRHMVEEALGIDPNAVHPNMSDYWKWAHMRSVPTIASMIGDITGTFRSMGSKLGPAMSAVTNVVTSSISGLAAASRPYLELLGNNIASHVRSIAGKLASTKVGERISQTIGAGITRGQSYVTTATSKVVSAINTVVTSVNAKFPNLSSKMVSAFSAMGNAGITAANKLRAGLSTAFAPLNTFQGQLRRLTTALKNEFDASTAKGQKLRASIDNIKKGMESLTAIAGKVTDAFKGIFNATKNIISNIKLGKSATDGLNKSAKATHNTFSSLVSLIAPYLSIFYVFQALGKSMKLGMDATETEAMYQTVFKTSGALEEMNAYVDELSSTLGLSRVELQNNTAMMYNFAKNVGLGNNEALALSKDLTMLAQDMASFYNVDPTDVFNNLKSGLSGSAEVVSKYGMNLYEANVKQYAYSKGIAAMGTELTQSQKVMARYMLMMEQAGVAHGDLERTLRSPANQLRMLKQDFTTLGTVIGQAMQPILTVALPALRELVQYLTYAATKVKEFTYTLAGLMGIDMNFGITGGIVNENASELSNGYDDAADSIDDTTEAAKRLQRQLGSADELNILASNKDQMEKEKPADPGLISTLENNLDESESITQKFANRFAEIVAEIVGAFKEGFDRYLPDLTNSINMVRGAWQSMCDSLSNLLRSVWDNGGREFVVHMGEITAAIGIAAAEIGRGILDALGNLWDHLDPSSNPASQKFIDHMNSLATTVRDALLGIGDAFAEFMKYGGQDVFNTLVDTALTAGSLFAQAAETIIEVVGKIWEHISPKNNPATQEFLLAFKNLLLTVQGIVTKVTDSLDGFTESRGMTFLEVLFDKFINIGTAVTNSVSIIVGEIEKLWGYLDPASNPYVDKLVQSFMNLLDKFGELDTIIQNFLDNGGSGFLQNMADIAAIIGTAVLDAVTWLVDHLDELAPILETVSGIAKNVLEFVSEHSEGLLAMGAGIVVISGALSGLVSIGTGLGTIVQAINGFISAGPLISAAWSAVTGAIGGISAPVVAIVAGIAALIFAIKQLWTESDEFRNKWIEVWENIKSVFGTLWNTILKPIVEDLKDGLSRIWNDALKPLWEQFKYVVEQIGIIFADLINVLAPIINAIIALFGPAITTAFGTTINFLVAGFKLIADVISTVLEAVGDILKGIKEVFQGIIDFVVGVFTGDWERAWEGVKSVFKGIFDSFVGIIKAPINLLIDALNFCINALNSISIDIPDWEWIPDGLQGKSWGFNIPNIPKLAKGGIIDSPTIAQIGERGKEAVMPLERNTGWIDDLASKIGTNIVHGLSTMGNSNNNNGDARIDITVKLGTTNFGTAAIKSINEVQRKAGRTLLEI